MLSTKKGKEAYVEAVKTGDQYHFAVKVGKPEDAEGAAAGTSAGKRAAFKCLMSDVPVDYNYIRAEGKAGKMGSRMMAIVVEGARGRVYLSPTKEMEAIALKAEPSWKPGTELPDNPRDFKTPNYGLTTFGDLFTPRQLVALNTFSDLVGEARGRVEKEALATGFRDDGLGLADGGTGARAYAEAVSVYLGFVIDKCADYWSSICTWHNSGEKMRNTFGRQAIPMTWDFAEANPFCDSSGNWMAMVDWTWKAVAHTSARAHGFAHQFDAQTQTTSANKLISTDPPYYDNIGYADLSDFFYVWLRRVTSDIFPEIFSTLAVPKSEELVATPYRHGSKEKAESFFLTGMTLAMNRLAMQGHPGFPLTIYYAFKQSETKDSGDTVSAGWVTFLDAVLKSGCSIVGTWPMRTELSNRMIGSGTNALASSIVLVCRARPADATTISRRQFQRELNAVLPEALDRMTKGSGAEHSPVAPVDLSQAIIGPGMAVFSKYAAVLEADGSAMSVKTALQLINRFLAGDDFDPDTQFCLDWFKENGWSEGAFGQADTLARSKGTAVDGVKAAGIIVAGGGVVRLLKWAEYPSDWDPSNDTRLPVWEALHQLIRAFKSGGESAAGALLAPIIGKAEAARQLAYRLYTLCERSGWAEDARAYNEIVTSWDAIDKAASRVPGPKQGSLFGI
jgi:putative DNA methylase